MDLPLPTPKVSPVAGASATPSSSASWNGSAWSIVPSPQTGEGGFLDAIVDMGSDNVWVAGDEIDHWNGATWSQMATVNGRIIHAITAIAATASDDIWFADVDDFIHYGCHPTS